MTDKNPAGSTVSLNSQSPAVGGVIATESPQRPPKRMSFLVVHDISDQSPYAILKVPQNATTKDVIKQVRKFASKFGPSVVNLLF